MPSRQVTLLELWQTCRMCEDSCRRMADVLVELMRQADSAVPPRQPALIIGIPDPWPIPEPDPPCVPPFCLMEGATLAQKAEVLARRVAVLLDAARALNEQDPRMRLSFYTSIPGGTGTASS
jgi:hypothetical protein